MLTLLITALAHPITISTDLDNDALLESIEVDFRDEHLVVVVEEAGTTTTLDLGVHHDIMGARNDVVVERVADLPLIALHLPSGDYCGSGNVWIYLSYVGGVPRNALEVSDYFDAPLRSTVELDFHSKGKTVRILQSTSEDGADVQTTVQRLRFEDGIYQ